MSDALFSALKRRFAAHAEALPDLVPILVSSEPTPFLARYRPDALHGLPEPTFRKLRQAAREERDLARRRTSVRRGLEQSGALTEALAKLVDESHDPAVLEDLARPLRAAKAAESAGDAKPVDDPMRPVARLVVAGETSAPLAEVLAPFCGADGAPPTPDDQRARLVRLVADLLGDDVEDRRAVRAAARRGGEIVSSLEARKETKEVFRPFADLRKPITKIPARVLLLLRRGQKAGAVRAKLELAEDERAALLAGPLAPREGHPYADLLREAAIDALDRVLLPSAMHELLKERKRAAEKALFPLFAQALHEKLLVPPAGAAPVVVVVPGATGTCRIAVVDAHGKPGTTAAVHPLPPRNETEEAAKALVDAVKDSGARLVAIAASGRARALREWVLSVLAANKDLGAVPVFINEAAAAAWSETEAGKAAEPELPATVRVALSIGRLVQDPLAEAVRYDLCEIPLGPNQRDVDQGELRRRLDETVEACVAEVGVDVNSASVALLARVPGLDPSSAAKIVAVRETSGPFATRADVRKVEGLDELAWQHAAGFLRIKGGVEPLDATGVHPTGAVVVPAIAAKLGLEPAATIGRADLLASLDAKEFSGPVLTEGDVRSVIAELGRSPADPRGSFVPPAFNPGVARTKDLAPEMVVEGVVTSLSKFGAFIDVGVGQDGLVHVSELAHQFVRDPSDVVKVGDRVRVKVVAVDNAKRRISLSIKALLPLPERPPEVRRERPAFTGRRDGAAPDASSSGGPPGGPQRPRRPQAEGGQAPDGPRGGRGVERRGPGGFVPERPGTAPRRAQRRGGHFGDSRGKDAAKADGDVDLSRDSGSGSFGSLTGGGRRFERPRRDEAPPRRAEGARGLDPFQQQLAALRAKLAIAEKAPDEAPTEEPVQSVSAAPAAPAATDPGGEGDRPTQ